MPEPRSISIQFRPGMYPADRHAIEDELEEALGELAEITGGGTAMDLSASDTSLDVTDFEASLRIIREVLRRLQVSELTVIVEYEPEYIEHRVYE